MMSDRQELNITSIIRQLRWGDHLFAGVATLIAVMLVVIFTDVRLWHGGVIAALIIMALGVRFLLAPKMPSLNPLQSIVNDQVTALQRVQATLNALPEPVILMLRDGTVVMSNPATLSFLGEIADGQHISALMRAPKVHEAVKATLETGQAQTAEFNLTGSVSRACRAYVTLIDSSDSTGLGTSRINEASRLLLFITDLSNEKRLEQMRSDFIANVSHELRTPLASMLGFMETLRGHAKEDPEAQEKFLGIMQSQAERMMRLVRDLMSLSSIELNEHMLPDEEINLMNIAHEVAASLEPVAEKYKATLTVESDLEEGQGVVIGDRDQIFQVIQNLADNALKYGGPKANVTIEVGKNAPRSTKSLRVGETAALISTRAGVSEEDLLYIQVRDEGKGIDRDDLPRLTERFYRADVQASKARGGTGLGLAIVKHILNRHKGGLQIETEEAKGTAFTCFLLRIVD